MIRTLFIFLVFVSPSFAAEPDCAEATSNLAKGETTQQFKQLLEHLVISKGALTVEALQHLAQGEIPSNPALNATLSPYDQRAITHGFDQILAEKKDPVDWDDIRQWINTDLLKRLGVSTVKRETAKKETELLPVPHVVQTLEVVQGNTANPTTEVHGSGFVRNNEPYGVMRATDGTGLVAINLNDGKIETLNPGNQYTKQIETLEENGKVHVVTFEGSPPVTLAYQAGGGVTPKLLVDPLPLPLQKYGLSAGTLGGEPVAVSAVHPSRTMNEPERTESPGLSLYYLNGNKKTKWIDSEGLYLRDPTLATVGSHSFIGAIDGNGKTLFIADPATGKKISRTEIDGYGSGELSKASNAPYFYEMGGQPRTLIPVHKGFEVLDPLTGKSIKTIPVENTEFQKGMRTLSYNGKLYGLTNEYNNAIVIDLSENKLAAKIPSGERGITSQVFPVKKGNKSYLTWSTYDGHIFLADISGIVLSNVQVIKGQIKIYHPVTVGDETRALVAPHDKPAMIVDLFSEPKP